MYLWKHAQFRNSNDFVTCELLTLNSRNFPLKIFKDQQNRSNSLIPYINLQGLSHRGVAPRFAEINANMTKNAKERAEAQLREAKQDLEHWRSKVGRAGAGKFERFANI